MDCEKFEEKLNDINLSKKELSQLTNLPYQTIMNWKRNNKVPAWIDSWLENYVKAKSYENVKNVVFDIEKVKE